MASPMRRSGERGAARRPSLNLGVQSQALLKPSEFGQMFDARAPRAFAANSSAVRHPLDPLSASEIAAAAHILRREQGLSDRWRFASIELREPSKDALRGG